MNLLCLVALIIINDVRGEASSLKVGKRLPYSNPIVEDEKHVFPDVEYPQSVLESIPFFYKETGVLEPFSDDVKSNFKSIVATSKKSEQEPPPLLLNRPNFEAAKNAIVDGNEFPKGDRQTTDEKLDEKEKTEIKNITFIQYENDSRASSKINEDVEHTTIEASNNTNGDTEVISFLTEYIPEDNTELWSKKFDNKTSSYEPIATEVDFDDFEDNEATNTNLSIDESNYQIEKPLLLNDNAQELREKRSLSSESENNVDYDNKDTENIALEQISSQCDNKTSDVEQESLDKDEKYDHNATIVKNSFTDQMDEQIESPLLSNETEKNNRKKRSTPTATETTNNDNETSSGSKINSESSTSSFIKTSTAETFCSSEAVLPKPLITSDEDDGIIIEDQVRSVEDDVVALTFEENCVTNELKEEDMKDL